MSAPVRPAPPARAHPIPVPARLPLLFLGILSLATGLWGALGRMGFSFPPPRPGPMAFHGALMVTGFLGTLISLERAVGLARGWAVLAPLTAGLGALSLLVAPGTPGFVLMTLGGVFLAAILAAVFRLQPSWAGAILAVGAVCWAAGSALFLLGLPLPRVAGFWIAFLTLTIAGERLELARFLAPSQAERATFLAACAGVVVGPLLALSTPEVGVRLAGAGAVALAVWLSLRDMARHGIRRGGAMRYTSSCLLSGYGWLALSGALALVQGPLSAGPLYDAWLHAFFLGFVMAMIFGHAPIIFPALLARPIPFRKGFYVHLALLHVTLALRVAGDFLGAPEAVRAGGLGNVLAILLFFASTLASLLRAARRSPRAGLVSG